MSTLDPVADFVRGRLAVVTGAASGIGLALAAEAASREASTIAMLDIDEPRLTDASAAIRALGANVEGYPCDVTDPTRLAAVAERLQQRHGPPGLLCANAGVAAPFSAVADESLQTAQWVFAVNVLGVLSTIHCFLPGMLASAAPSRLLVSGSEHGLCCPHRGLPSYTASKHALFAYCDLLRRELPPHIRVVFLAASMVNTDLWDAERTRQPAFGPRSAPDAVSRPVMRRSQAPAEVARMAIDALDGDSFVILTHSRTRLALDERVAQLSASHLASP